MTTTDAQFDEYRGGPPSPLNLISFPKHQDFHRATRDAIPWAECDHDAERVAAPSILIEKMFRKAVVAEPAAFARTRFLTRCLGVEEFLGPAVDLLVEEGFLVAEGEDAEGDLHRFKDPDALYAKADKMVEELKDAPELSVNPDSLDWLNGYTNTSEREQNIAWFAELSLDKVFAYGTLQAYVDLGLAVGPRSVHAERIAPTSQFYAVVGSGGHGGQLAHCVQKYYFTGGTTSQAVDPAFLLDKVTSFFVDTEWPQPYRAHLAKSMEYAYELPHRAAWKTATRQEWLVIITNKIGAAIRSLPTLEMIFRDMLDHTLALSRGYEALGDAVLGTTTGLPFWRIEDVEAMLTKDYGELIENEREAGTHSSDILVRLHDRLKASHSGGATDRSAEGDGEAVGPRPGLMAKACATQAYTKLDIKYTPILEGPMTIESKLCMFKECLGAKTVLPKAAIFASKGRKMSAYIGSSGIDFLTLLHGLRHLLPLYIMQSLAYDEDRGEVPKHMRTLVYDLTETRKLCDFKWSDLDLLNHVVLFLRGARAGTTFAKHSQLKMYHDGDIIRMVQDAGSKLFESIGYPSKVSADEGWTFRAFVGQVARLHQYAIALAQDERKNAFAKIDSFVARAFEAAAQDAERAIYGPSPADTELSAWISADEAVVMEMKDLLDGLEEHAQHRRMTLGVFSKSVQAASLPTLTSRGEDRDRDHDDGNGRKRAKANNKAKSTPSGGKAPLAPDGGKKSSSVRGGGKTDRKNKAEDKHVFLYDDGDYSIGALAESQTAGLNSPKADIAQRRARKPAVSHASWAGAALTEISRHACPLDVPQEALGREPADRRGWRKRARQSVRSGAKLRLRRTPSLPIVICCERPPIGRDSLAMREGCARRQCRT